MAVDPNSIKRLIEQALPGAQVEVTDLVGDGDHLQAVVVAEQFRGISLVKQHQMVYSALQEELKEKLHALALKTYTPEQYQTLVKGKL